MKKTLFSLVCFLFSSVVFANDASTTTDSNFFDFLVKRKTIKAEYRHYFFSESNEKGSFKKFTRTPHFRVDIPVDIFGGVLVGTTKLKIENRDDNGYVKQPEFDLTSPYLNFESDILTAGLSVSYVFPLNGNTDKVDLNTNIGVNAPKINAGIGTISLGVAAESVVYFKTYNQDVAVEGVTAEDIRKAGDTSAFFLGEVEGSGEEPKVYVNTQRPDFEVNFTLLNAKLDLDSIPLYTAAVVEYFNAYAPKFKVADDGSKDTSWAIERTSKASWILGYKLSDSITIANTLGFGFNGLFADQLKSEKGWTIGDSNTGNVKVSETISVQFKL